MQSANGQSSSAGQSGSQQSKGHGKGWDEESASLEGEKSDFQSGSESLAKVLIEVSGTKSIPKLVARIADIRGVVSVHSGDPNSSSD